MAAHVYGTKSASSIGIATHLNEKWTMIPAVGVFVLASGMKLPPYVQLVGGGLHGSIAVEQICWLLLYAAAALGLLFKLNSMVRYLPIWLPAAFVSLLAIISSSYSVSSYHTVTTSIAFTMCSLVAIWLGISLSPSRFIECMKIATAIVTLVVLATIVVWGASAYDANGNLSGPFVHKNRLGFAMAITIIVWAYAERRGKAAQVARISIVGGASFCLWESNSKNAFLAAGLGALLVTVLPWLYRRKWSSGVLALVSLAVISMAATSIVAVGGWGTVTEWFGRDASLTGRTDIWLAVVSTIEHRPTWGYGYGAFWIHVEGLNDIRRATGILPANGHNGVLDALLAFGIVGTLLVLMQTVISFVVITRWNRNHPSRYSSILLTLLYMITAYNLVDSNLIEHNLLSWIYIVSAPILVLNTSGFAITSSHLPTSAAALSRCDSSVPVCSRAKRVPSPID